MKIDSVTYVIRDEDFPTFKEIRDIDDGRKDFFNGDYNRHERIAKSMAKACHSEHVPGKYWVQEIEKSFPELEFQYEPVIWGGESIMAVTSKKLLSDNEKAAILEVMREKFEYFSQIITWTFDFRQKPQFMRAQKLDAVAYFEGWLYGNIFAQTPNRCDKGYNHMKLFDGVYNMTFTIDADEYEVRKFVDEFISEEMDEYIDQDVSLRDENTEECKDDIL